MKQKENTLEQHYNDTLSRIAANSPYGRIPSKAGTYMTAAEMGRLLGLKKTERYWLLHKHYFEWEEIKGKFRVNIASFEKWYANQIKYKKITGEEPGLELKDWSYSPKELAELLGINEGSIYELINKNNIETVIVDYWKRVPKEAFYKWYNSQSRYRTKEDREKDQEIENATITMPEMARLLGVERNTVYTILKSPQYRDLFEMVIVADRKRITRESFDRFLEVQDKYRLDTMIEYEEVSKDINEAFSAYQEDKYKHQRPRAENVETKSFSYQEAACFANVSRSTIHNWVVKKKIPVVQVMNVTRIPRQELEDFLKRQRRL